RSDGTHRGRHPPRRRARPRAGAREARPAGPVHDPRGPVGVPQPHGRGEPHPRLLRRRARRRRAGDRLRLLPEARAAPQAARRHHVGRGAADARALACAGLRPRAAAARRAVDGTRTAHRRGAVRHRRADRRDRRLDPVHRAVRADRPAGLRLCRGDDRWSDRGDRRARRDQPDHVRGHPGRCGMSPRMSLSTPMSSTPMSSTAIPARVRRPLVRGALAATALTLTSCLLAHPSLAVEEPEAEAPPAAAFSGYSSAASASPLKIEIYEPTIPIPSEPQAEVMLAYTRADTSSGSGKSRATWIWPGDAIGEGLKTFVEQLGLPAILGAAGYPVQTNAEHPGGPDHETL